MKKKTGRRYSIVQQLHADGFCRRHTGIQLPFGFETIWLAPEAMITTTENVSVVPNYDFLYHPPIDILFVPGGDSNRCQRPNV
jgi:hypothetical protein